MITGDCVVELQELEKERDSIVLSDAKGVGEANGVLASDSLSYLTRIPSLLGR